MNRDAPEESLCEVLKTFRFAQIIKEAKESDQTCGRELQVLSDFPIQSMTWNIVVEDPDAFHQVSAQQANWVTDYWMLRDCSVLAENEESDDEAQILEGDGFVKYAKIRSLIEGVLDATENSGNAAYVPIELAKPDVLHKTASSDPNDVSGTWKVCVNMKEVWKMLGLDSEVTNLSGHRAREVFELFESLILVTFASNGLSCERGEHWAKAECLNFLTQQTRLLFEKNAGTYVRERPLSDGEGIGWVMGEIVNDSDQRRKVMIPRTSDLRVFGCTQALADGKVLPPSSVVFNGGGNVTFSSQTVSFNSLEKNETDPVYQHGMVCMVKLVWTTVEIELPPRSKCTTLNGWLGKDLRSRLTQRRGGHNYFDTFGSTNPANFMIYADGLCRPLYA